MAAPIASPVVGGRQRRVTRAVRPGYLVTSSSRGALSAASLRTLPEGWFVMHDVAWPGRPHVTIDHVVIGPGGVFVIDDKSWSGEVDLDFTRLHHNGMRRDSAIGNAVEAAHAIVRSSPHASPGHVHPLLCFEAGTTVTGRSSQVLAMTADELATTLVTRPRVLSSREVVQIVVELEDVLAPHDGVGHAEERNVRVEAAPTALRYPLLPASGPEAIRVALALAFFLLMITQPMLVMSLPGHAASWIGRAF